MTKIDNLLSMAEFKGKVLEALDNIKKQNELNRIQHDMFFKRIRKLELKPSFSVNPIGWLMYWLRIRR